MDPCPNNSVISSITESTLTVVTGIIILVFVDNLAYFVIDACNHFHSLDLIEHQQYVILFSSQTTQTKSTIKTKYSRNVLLIEYSVAFYDVFLQDFIKRLNYIYINSICMIVLFLVSNLTYFVIGVYNHFHILDLIEHQQYVILS